MNRSFSSCTAAASLELAVSLGPASEAARAEAMLVCREEVWRWDARAHFRRSARSA